MVNTLVTPVPSLGELELGLAKLRHTLRPGQRELANWLDGPLAVSAVPGAGKSHGMAIGAVMTLAQAQLHRQKQLVIVTFTRSATANIKSRIRQHLNNLGLPRYGFSVQTLHGLALNIAASNIRHGLDLSQATLITDVQKSRILRRCAQEWQQDNPQAWQILLDGQATEYEETELIRRRTTLLSEVLPKLAQTSIAAAKSSNLSPADLANLAAGHPDAYPILEIAADLYGRYQTHLSARGLIDYDEMILAALRVLEDPESRSHWQTQVYGVFEDEAQDSTPLQTELLKILATDPLDPDLVNLVRVGDPNQAINSTFTPADPIFFAQFCQACADQSRFFTMSQAGRSSQIIIDAANYLVAWANGTQVAGPELPFQPQKIELVSPADPQPDANPPATGRGLEIYAPRDVIHTVALIGARVGQLLTENPQANAAVLVRENKQGRFVTDVLAQPEKFGLKTNLAGLGITVYDTGSEARRSHVPAELLNILLFLHRPHSPGYFKAALDIFTERQLIRRQDWNALVSQPELFLFPSPIDPGPQPDEQAAQQLCQNLLQARLNLALYPLIAYVANVLQYDPTELATADKLISQLAQQAGGQQTWTRISPIWQEIVSEEKFDAVELGDPDSNLIRPRQLTIMTMHKAKGLDWDYVFLPFLHDTVIPGNPWVPGSLKFLGHANLEEVARAQIRSAVHQRPILDINGAWEQANQLKTAEAYRLLYVAMTRAKRLLWMSAAINGPFSWASFNWHQSYKFDLKKPCPALDPLRKQFPQSQMSITY
ncbi:ATP-dependent helicase [Synechococcus sp. PCC 6312]|uniref:ATP-dependent helicase n=1 Tax=Synechococcus sp. (strain ATCC 27167 / PCC 6312) TaxID=195253 RepID=UPI00029F2749|nr:ATP-dependent helicase [Synechococcus sp. PCC 6312]AFY60134.1 DNA/RNA helicase, superfamily I [Synechococcus sp. PCC 6312]